MSEAPRELYALMLLDTGHGTEEVSQVTGLSDEDIKELLENRQLNKLENNVVNELEDYVRETTDSSTD